MFSKLQGFSFWLIIISVMVSGCSHTDSSPLEPANSTPLSSGSQNTPLPSRTLSPIPSLTLTPSLTREPSQTRTSTPIPSPTWTTTPVPTLPAGVNNEVEVAGFNSVRYHSLNQSFTNREVNGYFVTHSHIQNTADASNAPIYGLRLEFSADNQGLEPTEEHLIASGPEGFEWFFGNVEEEPIQNIYRSDAYLKSDDSYRVPFTPGFDASLIVDKEAFTEPGVQTVTLTITPREELDFLDFIFHLDGGAYGERFDATIANLEPGEHRGPAGERITVTADRKNIAVMSLPLVVNEPYSFSMTLQVNPLPGGGTTYRPYFSISTLPGSMAGPSEATGNSITIPVEGIGSWTWSAIGEYLWKSSGVGLQYALSLN